MKKKINLIQILTYLLILVFSVRIFCYHTNIKEYITLESSPISNFQTVISVLGIWFEYVGVLIVILRKFFDLKYVKILAKYFTIPMFLINLIFIQPIILLLQGNLNISLLFVLYIIEAVIGLGLSISYLVKEIKEKNNYKDILFTVLVFILVLIPAMPSFAVQFLFGYADALLKVKDFTLEHRMYLYIGIFVPFVIYFILRNKPQKVIDFSLIYLSLATLLVFVFKFDYTDFFKPWNWPIHLCNTAMFILPICLIFKTKKLFYFTYFINVLGALLAMLMPNYSDTTNIVSNRVFEFWYNHWIAFFMPLLCVALKVFKRPTLKEFKWSMIWFFAYFVIALVLNVYFTALGHDVDFFFINSDYIPDLLGKWAENIFDQTIIIPVGMLQLEFHPLYQIIFYFVYVLLGLAVWFVYSELFRMADSHYQLHLKLKKIREEERMNLEHSVHGYAHFANQGKEDLMIDQNVTASLKLDHFSKKYATSQIYAVEDANFEVHENEVFGFLGPNGAGKSTIIKSMVGIQPITSGKITVCGYDVATEPVETKSFIGYVPDHYALYEKLTGREYINYIADIYDVSKEEREERIEKYVSLFELEHSIDSKIRTYSHGMKQKITIISALVHNPKVWILDEPLTGLDPNSIYQVKKCMMEHAKEGNIVFFSSHLIDIVEKLCQRIAIIKKGKIKCVKTVEEIEASGYTLEEFYLKTIEEE